MLLNLHKKKWTDGLNLTKFDHHSSNNQKIVEVWSCNPKIKHSLTPLLTVSLPLLFLLVLTGNVGFGQKI